MLSQSIFELNIKTKRAFPLWAHNIFLFSLSSRESRSANGVGAPTGVGGAKGVGGAFSIALLLRGLAEYF